MLTPTATSTLPQIDSITGNIKDFRGITGQLIPDLLYCENLIEFQHTLPGYAEFHIPTVQEYIASSPNRDLLMSQEIDPNFIVELDKRTATMNLFLDFLRDPELQDDTYQTIRRAILTEGIFIDRMIGKSFQPLEQTVAEAMHTKEIIRGRLNEAIA